MTGKPGEGIDVFIAIPNPPGARQGCRAFAFLGRVRMAKKANPYYSTRHWKQLRTTALQRDSYLCTTPGCKQPGKVVDHIKTRPSVPYPTPLDRLDNLRTLCRTCDNQAKELAGKRKGEARAVGCDAHGLPLDPGHHWR